MRMSKAMQRVKKNKGQNQSNDLNSSIKTNKSLRVSNLAKELENKLQKRSNTLNEDDTKKNEVVYERNDDNNNNMVNVLKNQQLTKSFKKKKSSKKFFED